ncbi:hypothetical protein WOLCODRAFT_138047 [Wolfiporia cocos MD-104 SS10]|uniref:Spindle assembly checkpoint component MAD1 n=1 Tax=Wolfiporia cocos (strain MD-104) TaxID=742152 RepID=A0A2H3JKM8_WOLCO|nr:hypothetical protein WOLCODRAFT_138047 [Wolfiporia cocos MD-104 SS10]
MSATAMNATTIDRSSRTARARAAPKRGTLAAELESDPNLSSAKRQQRVKALSAQVTQASLERQLAAAHSARAELEARLRERDAAIERLESDRRWIADREREANEQRERESEQHEEDKAKLDAELGSLRATASALREQHRDLEDEYAALARSTSQTISAQQAQIATLTEQAALLDGQLAQAKQTAADRGAQLADLQAQLDDARSAHATPAHAEGDDWAIVRTELAKQAEHMRALEARNAKMAAELRARRERDASVDVLREQNRELQRRAQAADDLREHAARLEAEVQTLTRERDRWAAEEPGPSTPSKTPVAVTQTLSKLRLEHQQLLEEHGATAALLRQRDNELKSAEQQIDELQDELENVTTELDALRAKVARSDRSAALMEREVAFLKDMVASLTAEEASQNDRHVDDLAAQQIQQLDALVAEYKATVQGLRDELDTLSNDTSFVQHVRPLQDDLAAERAARADAEQALASAQEAAESKIDALEQALFDLRGEIGAGQHVPPGVRVLSLAENPAKEWFDRSDAAMARLRGENAALLARLKQLEASGARAAGGGEDLVPRASLDVAEQEKAALAEELKDKEKRMLRLRQVFNNKSAEFREAVEEILGVKLAFYASGDIRVTPQYDLSAQFVFKRQGNEARMQLVKQGAGGPEDLPHLIRYWIGEEQCIPGFIASVILESYEAVRRQQHAAD